MGCFGFCEGDDSYTPPDNGHFMPPNPTGNTDYHGRHAAITAPTTIDSSIQPDQEFLAQVSIVSRLKHENVVELVSYCVNGPLRALAHEYAPKESLHDIIYDLMYRKW